MMNVIVVYGILILFSLYLFSLVLYSITVLFYRDLSVYTPLDQYSVLRGRDHPYGLGAPIRHYTLTLIPVYPMGILVLSSISTSVTRRAQSILYIHYKYINASKPVCVDILILFFFACIAVDFAFIFIGLVYWYVYIYFYISCSTRLSEARLNLKWSGRVIEYLGLPKSLINSLHCRPNFPIVQTLHIFIRRLLDNNTTIIDRRRRT